MLINTSDIRHFLDVIR